MMWDDDEAQQWRSFLWGVVGAACLVIAILGVAIYASGCVRVAEAACSHKGQSCRTLADCCPNEGLICNNGCRPGTAVPTTTSSSVTTTVPGQPSTTLTPTTISPSTTTPPSPTTTVPPPLTYRGRLSPYRPNDCDLSVAWDDDTYALQGCELCNSTAHVCSQYERMVKEETLIKRATDVTDLFDDDCPQEASYAYGPSALDALGPRLNWPYKARQLCNGNVCVTLVEKYTGGGLWILVAKGHVYSIHRFILNRFRRCLMQPKKRARCVLFADASTKQLMNLNDACDGPSQAVQFFPFLPNKARESLAPLDSRPATIPINRAETARDVALLTALDDSHAHTTCGSTKSMIDVQTAMVSYEGACCQMLPCSERCLGFRFLPPFKGGCDLRWGDAGCCQWKDVTHFFFAKWVAAERDGNQATASQFGADHREAHNCMNNADARMLTIFSCPEEPENTPQCDYGTLKRGKRTCAEFLPILVMQMNHERLQAVTR